MISTGGGVESAAALSISFAISMVFPDPVGPDTRAVNGDFRRASISISEVGTNGKR
jgi:hypothetical protein